jgi:hypothetical protein
MTQTPETIEQCEGELLIIKSEINSDCITETCRDALRKRKEELLRMISDKQRQELVARNERQKALIKTGKKLIVGAALSYAWRKITS